MRFFRDGDRSKIYVIYIGGTLVFRTISAYLFGRALWVMYKSMQNFKERNKTSRGANHSSFYLHMLVLLLYLGGRTCSTIAYAKAAW